ncbi:MAG: hypothetical protein AAGL66_17125, partial [Pseudomonadota bacterium]
MSRSIIRASSCATRLGRLRSGLGLVFVLLLLASCAANNTDDMLAQAEREIAAAQASAESRVADAERRVADARSQVDAITRENANLRDGQKALRGALQDAESRAAAIETTLQRTQR